MSLNDEAINAMRNAKDASRKEVINKWRPMILSAAKDHKNAVKVMRWISDTEKQILESEDLRVDRDSSQRDSESWTTVTFGNRLNTFEKPGE